MCKHINAAKGRFLLFAKHVLKNECPDQKVLDECMEGISVEHRRKKVAYTLSQILWHTYVDYFMPAQ